MNKILFIILIITIPLVILGAGHFHGQAEDAPGYVQDKFAEIDFGLEDPEQTTDLDFKSITIGYVSK